MSAKLRRDALNALLQRTNQLLERADLLLALHNALAFETAPTHDRFNALAKETGAADWEDYANQYTPLNRLQAWLDANTYRETDEIES